jgi:tetratricopeptide (TPR) repeat protein
MKIKLSIAAVFVCISFSANAKDQNLSKVARLIEAGQYHQALLSIAKVKTLSIELARLKAVSHLKLEQYAQAELAYIELKRVDDGVDVNNNLGIVYLRQARYAEAVVLFRDTIRRFPSDSAAYENLGDFYVYLGQATYAKGVGAVTKNDVLQANLDQVGTFFVEKSEVGSPIALPTGGSPIAVPTGGSPIAVPTGVEQLTKSKWRIGKGVSLLERELDLLQAG